MGDVSTKFLSILHYRDDCNWRKVKCVSDDVLGTQTHFEHAYKNGTITKWELWSTIVYFWNGIFTACLFPSCWDL